MAIDFITREKFNEFIKQITLSYIDTFSPSKFSKYANISIDDSFKLLVEHVATKELELVWELRCPNCNKVLTIDDSRSFEEYECVFCNEIFDVDDNDLYPKFRVSNDYRTHLLEKNKDVESEKKFEIAITNLKDEDISVSEFKIDEETKRILAKESPSLVCNIFLNGGLTMNNISDSFNNSNVENNNIQSTYSQTPIISNEQLGELEEHIEHIDDEVVKEMNERYVKELNQSLKEHDIENAKKLLNYIGKTIGKVPVIIAMLEKLSS
ncbi:hypothetical protein [Staphylococcus felis]|uniref:hypothetical protein n=1 Tax=Staphylococcus felis TaxID=46127 RepID=UPI000E266B75|nr:hypothetical protein [Staphylococcus felis]REH78765.1 hypothetical protein DOS60_03310 [Staphylococcus felis]REH98361.1 hypothetical protein DOS67_01405 [Staphylococcus felis]REI04716.1 hypothetical protein DOS62_05210 [Staphylococcus felis]REI33372.1 hypothetical protein DOS80_03410 [Staphylococcus felis]